ncbi:FadR/GntR family transcriptional regulator [Hyalangium gracile]|uniref:FadR/GntR family transcriptional regulator n=1 Tax=Hyalangium gracile TaxID=394092 RepID=UPI001CCE2C16|nr:GntR family transcriptional regulator [Hyalangium gracile]
MEHKGLVSRVSEQLERIIARGQLPKGGQLPSEQTLAKRYGVSRATIRGALQDLAARGLVVRHPGRRSRAATLDEALTLESLRLVLPAEGPEAEGRRRLLEGFFALKREVTVELLAACCEHGRARELTALEDGCFALADETRWNEERRAWVQREFELLRRAARAADRPGHMLLIQSLERSFWGIAEWVLPHLQPGAIDAWARCAMYALGERDAQSLRHQLPALLRAADEGLLDSLVPIREEPTPPEPSTPASSVEEPGSGADCPNLSTCQTGSVQALAPGELHADGAPAHADMGSGPLCPVDATDPLSPCKGHGSSSNPGCDSTSVSSGDVSAPPPGQPDSPAALHAALPPSLPLEPGPDGSGEADASMSGSEAGPGTPESGSSMLPACESQLLSSDRAPGCGVRRAGCEGRARGEAAGVCARCRT